MMPTADIERRPTRPQATVPLSSPPPAQFDPSRKDQALRTLIDDLLEEQRTLSAVESFSRWHDRAHTEFDSVNPPASKARYTQLMPAAPPSPGEQYAFEVNLDACSGCKACVTACHTLNGLDDGEAWREVGTLVGVSADSPWQQTVTSACHHCVDPGCLNGCPVLAYEKDPLTGIVRHLDDQCIGCQYCVLKCPYEVPKYSKKRGIVRKCDLCSQRLAVDEAPACAQACPNQAIRVTVVRPQAVRKHAGYIDLKTARSRHPFLPGAPDPRWTLPTTQFKTVRPELNSGQPADLGTPQPQPVHAPLVAMLTLTQIGVGIQAAGLWASEPGSLSQKSVDWISAWVILAGLAASTAHLGRPLKAWRAFLGLRRSWLSREIVIFGLLPPLLFIPLIGSWLPVVRELIGTGELWRACGVSVGMIGIVCSAMIYHDTGRHSWRGWRTFSRFLGTTLLSALATHWWIAADQGRATIGTSLVLLVVVLAKWLLESRSWKASEEDSMIDPWQMQRSVTLLRGVLARANRARTVAASIGAFGFLAATLAGAHAPAGLLLGVFGCASLAWGEFCERALFFRAVSTPRMPGLNNQNGAEDSQATH